MVVIVAASAVAFNNLSIVLTPETSRGQGKIDPFPSIVLALNLYSLTDYQKLWYHCSLFVSTSFDAN